MEGGCEGGTVMYMYCTYSIDSHLGAEPRQDSIHPICLGSNKNYIYMYMYIHVHAYMEVQGFVYI